MLVTPVPWAGRVVALPVLPALVPSERFQAGSPRAHACVVTRLRLDANQFAPAQARRGVEPSHRRALVRQTRPCHRGRTGTAVWYHGDLPLLPIPWIIVRDPTGRRKPLAFLATDPDVMPEAMLDRFVSRWRLDVTFEEVRAHLGVETRRQWSDLAIARTRPALLGLFSLVVLWMDDLVKAKQDRMGSPTRSCFGSS